jgi:hypothetical protein
MNEPIQQLQEHVEETVGRLRAASRTKAIMREELLAYLIDVYDQESHSCESAAAAMEATLCRFGDRREISRELQASVPARERIFSMLFNKELRMWRWLIVSGVLAFLLGTSLVLPALARLKQLAALAGDSSPAMHIFALTMGMLIAVCGMHALGWGIVRTMRKAA